MTWLRSYGFDVANTLLFQKVARFLRSLPLDATKIGAILVTDSYKFSCSSCATQAIPLGLAGPAWQQGGVDIPVDSAQNTEQMKGTHVKCLLNVFGRNG